MERIESPETAANHPTKDNYIIEANLENKSRRHQNFKSEIVENSCYFVISQKKTKYVIFVILPSKFYTEKINGILDVWSTKYHPKATSGWKMGRFYVLILLCSAEKMDTMASSFKIFTYYIRNFSSGQL